MKLGWEKEELYRDLFSAGGLETLRSSSGRWGRVSEAELS